MHISVITIFPEMFKHFWKGGVIRRAVRTGRLSYSTYSIRDFSFDKNKTVDDRPYGGGCGMLIKASPIVSAIKIIKKRMSKAVTVFLSPQGKKLNQDLVSKLALFDGLILLCGRYEGIDERVLDAYVDFEISIGDYVLSGGELPAMVLIDSVSRMLPNVLGNSESHLDDTFSKGLIKHAQYSRPKYFEGEEVPDVLISGDHKEIKRWRHETSLLRTLSKRRDLLEEKKLTLEEIKILRRWYSDLERILKKQSVFSSDSLSGFIK